MNTNRLLTSALLSLVLGCAGPELQPAATDAGGAAGASTPSTGPSADGGVTPAAGGGAPDAGSGAGCFPGTDEGDLPDRVLFRTKTMSFNARWAVALHDGLIYVKPNTTGGAWRLLGTGVPSGGGLTHFTPPVEVSELSADGTWLHALSPQGVFYRGTDFTQDVHSNFSWSDSWGHPAATGSGMTTEFATTHGWSVSDSQPPGVHHYEDPLGTVHSVGLGVAHVYRVGADGRSLHFNDWWLPNDWSRQICLPERGTFFVENLNSSASTSFIIGTQGTMYTRLFDFDTSGENDLLTYSFGLSSASGETRALPAEDWRRQPDITDGLITRKITIFQDGQGNAARMLRVEGVRQGRTGFYFKRLTDAAWSFEETGYRVCGPFLNAAGRAPAPTVAPNDTSLRGTLSGNRQGSTVSVELRLSNFNIVCSPADAQLLVGGRVVTAGGVPLVVPFHHVHSLTLSKRATSYWQSGAPAVLRAALMTPANLTQVDDPVARQKLLSLFGTRKVINLKGTATTSHLNLVQMTWVDPLIGVVPGSEKADPGSELRLDATP